LGAAAAVRDSAVAIGLVLGVLYLLPIVAAVVSNATVQRHLLQTAPMTAGLNILATTGLRSLPLSPWQGLAVLTAWAAVALLAGGLLLRVRDARGGDDAGAHVAQPGADGGGTDRRNPAGHARRGEDPAHRHV